MGSEDKVKDRWDKAQIISGFVASVVIAAVGLTVNYSIQQTQIESSRQNAEIQAALAKQIAESQKKIQESVLTGQLVEHLASKDSIKRRIAVVALEHAVPSETYESVVSIVAKFDESTDVRITAYQQAGNLKEPGPDITKHIVAASEDSSKTDEERQVARVVVDKLEEGAIAGLRPEAGSLARKLVENAREKGIEIRVIAGHRSLQEQEELFRRVPKVTNARVSVHNTGLAFDIGIFEKGKYLEGSTKREGQLYEAVGALGKELGLEWGGDGKVFKDMPHFETRNAQDEHSKLKERLANTTP